MHKNLCQFLQKISDFTLYSTMGNNPSSGNTPTLDNVAGYSTLLGSPFSSPLSPTSSFQYAGVDQNYPLAEFSAKVDDSTLQDLIFVVNKYFGVSFTLAGVRDTTPSGQAVQLFNLVIQQINGYNRTLYNYALPILNLGVLIAKQNGTSVTPTTFASPLNPLTNNIVDFIHNAVLLLFETMAQEGRTYNEMALQAFGGTDRDGLDTENKYKRLTHFWRHRTSSVVNDDINRFRSIFTDANNLGLPLPSKLNVVVIDNGSGSGVLSRTPGSITVWGDPTVESKFSLIGYLKEFTFPTGSYLSDPSTQPYRSNADLINFMKSIVAGIYTGVTNESKLVGNPPVPSAFAYRNAYSLNPTITYNILLGPFPALPVSPPALAQYPAAVTYGDYLVILLWRLFNFSGLPTTGTFPGRPTDVLASIQPTTSRTSNTVYSYADIVVMVNAVSAYISANSLQTVLLPAFGKSPSVAPNFEIEPSPQLTVSIIPDNGYSVMATFFPNNTFVNTAVYTTPVTPLFNRPMLGDAYTTGIFDQINLIFPNVVSILSKIFRIRPPFVATSSFTLSGSGNNTPVTSASINTTTNFFQQNAVINLWNNSLISDFDLIYDSALDSKVPSSIYNDGALANLTIAYLIFTMVAQEYVNINGNTLQGAIANYFTITPISGSPGYFTYSITGDLLSIIKITLVLLDRLYVFFASRFNTSVMMSYNSTLLSTNPPVSITQPTTPAPVVPYSSSAIAQLMGLSGGISTSSPSSVTFDPINYTAFLSFAILLNYNYEFTRELTQDISTRYLLQNQVVINEGSLVQTILDMERRINNLQQPVGGFNSDQAFNAFNNYQNKGAYS
jgi:hypothetical protein